PRARVVIGQREDRGCALGGASSDLFRRGGAVGTGGMAMQFDEHERRSVARNGASAWGQGGYGGASMPAPSAPLVALRDRREQVIAVLTEQFSRDTFELDELERRLDLAHRADTVAAP